MHTTIQILDAIAAKHGGATDYRLSKLLGTSTSAVANWRKGRSTFANDYAVRAAALLDWEPAYVIACMERERAERLEATDEIKLTWEKIAQRFKPAAAILAVMFLLGLASNQVVRSAEGTASRVQFIHYAQWRRVRRWLRRSAQFLCIAVMSAAAAADPSECAR